MAQTAGPALAEAITALAAENALSLSQVGDAAHIPKSTFHRVLRSGGGAFSYAQMRDIARVLGVTTAELAAAAEVAAA